VQARGDLGVAVALGQELERLALARGQRPVRRRAPARRDRVALERRREIGLARPHDRERFEQLLRRRALEHVARGPRLEDLVHEVGVFVHREHEHAGARQALADAARDLEPVQVRHRDVHHDHVRARALDLDHGLVAVAGLAHHLHARVALQQRAQAVAEDRVVVGEEDPERRHRVRGTRRVATVPPPGAGARRTSPSCRAATARAMVRPSPRPRALRVETNGSKARARTSGDTPSPSSVT
jgi:hypothetical protein